MGTNATNIAEIAIIAYANQMNDSSLEMRLVASFWVTPVIPQKTRAIAANQSQVGNIDKILAAQKFMGTLRQQADQLNQVLPLLSQVPPAADYTGILKAAENARTLRDKERKLRRDLAELNTVFWFVDETKWARHD